MVQDSRTSDWIYVVKSVSSEVIFSEGKSTSLILIIRG